MAPHTVASLTKPDTLVTIKFLPHGTSGLAWEGKEYGPGGQAAGFNGGDTVTLPAYWAARWIGKGRAVLVGENDGETPPGEIDNRDPEPRRRR
jgi:hypothetical protein